MAKVFLKTQPVPRKFFISDLKYFVTNLISGQKFFLKCLNKAWIFFTYFISYPNSDQKLAKSRLFLARKKSAGGSRISDCYIFALSTRLQPLIELPSFRRITML